MKRTAWLTVLFGWVIAAALAFSVGYLMLAIGSGVNTRAVRWVTYGVALTAQPIGALVGGLVTARLARRHFTWHGLLVGLLTLLVEFTRWAIQDLSLPPILIPVWLGLPLAGALGGWLAGRLPGNQPVSETVPSPRWIFGAVAGMAGFLLVGGLLLFVSVKNEAGFIYIDALTLIGYITQAVLLPGYLARALLPVGGFRLSPGAELGFMLVVSGLPWAACGALLASGRKKWAAIFATVTVLGSAVPAIVFWLMAQALDEGPP